MADDLDAKAAALALRREKAEQELQEARERHEATQRLRMQRTGTAVTSDILHDSDSDELLDNISGGLRTGGGAFVAESHMYNAKRPKFDGTGNEDELRDTQERLRYASQENNINSNRLATLEYEKRNLLRRLETMTSNSTVAEGAYAKMEHMIKMHEQEMKAEAERRRNSEMQLRVANDQLATKERLYTAELSDKQGKDLELRSIQGEVRRLREDLALVEEDRNSSEKRCQEGVLKLAELKDANDHFQKQLALKATQDTTIEDQRCEIENQGSRIFQLRAELEQLSIKGKDAADVLNEQLYLLQVEMTNAKEETKLAEDALTQASVQNQLERAGLQKELELKEEELRRTEMATDILRNQMEAAHLKTESVEKALITANEDHEKTTKVYEHEKDKMEDRIEELDAEVGVLNRENQDLHDRLVAEGRRSQAKEKGLIEQTTLAEEVHPLQKEVAKLRVQLRQAHADQDAEKGKSIQIQSQLDMALDKVQQSQEELLSFRLGNCQKLEQAGMDTHQLSRSLQEMHYQDSEKIRILRDQMTKSETNLLHLDRELKMAQAAGLEAERKLAKCQAEVIVSSQMKEIFERENLTLKGQMENLNSQLTSARELTVVREPKLQETLEQLHEAQHQTMATKQQMDHLRTEMETIINARNSFQEKLRTCIEDRERLQEEIIQEKERTHTANRETEKTRRGHTELEQAVQSLKKAEEALHDKLGVEALSRADSEVQANESKGILDLETKTRARISQKLLSLEEYKKTAEAMLAEEKRHSIQMTQEKEQLRSVLTRQTEKKKKLEKAVAILKVHLKAAKKRIAEVTGQFSSSNIEEEHVQNLNSPGKENRDNISQGGRSEPGAQSLSLKIADLQHENRSLQGNVDFYKTQLGDADLTTSPEKLTELRRMAETEMRSRLNKRLGEVNSFLTDHSQTQEKVDRLRDETEQELRERERHATNAMHQMEMRVSELEMFLKLSEMEVTRYKQLFEVAVPKVPSDPPVSMKLDATLPRPGELEAKLDESIALHLNQLNQDDLAVQPPAQAS